MINLPFRRTTFIIILSVLTVGIGSVSAIGFITLNGDTIITGGLDVSGGITGATITGLDSRIVTLEQGGTPQCGNSIQEAGEVCDGSDLVGLDCTDFGYTSSGTLQCAGGCTGFDTGSFLKIWGAN